MKKMMNFKLLFSILFVILVVVAINYFNSMPIEPDNTSMNNDDSITFSIDQYESPTNTNYMFIENKNDISFNSVKI
jgi:hypothetical protein